MSKAGGTLLDSHHFLHVRKILGMHARNAQSDMTMHALAIYHITGDISNGCKHVCNHHIPSSKMLALIKVVKR
jgi:hypothetical protein